jgi:hydrogenase expression/formation protein HypD
VFQFRDKERIGALSKALEGMVTRPMKFMEVCGTHTVSFFRFGLWSLVPDRLSLLSGPGCPVCVTPQREIRKAFHLAQQDGVILATFGDMMRVPVDSSSLEKQRAVGAHVRVVTSALEALDMARENGDKKVVFFAVGFETTAPTVAQTILHAAGEGVSNFFILCAHKLIPPAMRALLDGGEVRVDGFMCPGHVSAIIGSAAYEEISARYSVPCVVSGFEPLDMLETLVMLVEMAARGEARVRNQYRRVVKPQGNRVALESMGEVFGVKDAEWRGLGMIPASGLGLKDGFAGFDAENEFDLKQVEGGEEENKGCRCGDVLRGALVPEECPLFGVACTPSTPLGPCMVSSEGTCGAHYKYRTARDE